MHIRTILVDDELYSLKQFELECESTDIEIVGKFDNAKEALSYAARHKVECAVLDIRMPDMDGIELGRKLKKINYDTIVIYVTGYDDYIKDAVLDVKADYYLMKPYDHEDLEKVFDRIEHLSGKLRKRVFVRTFDEFDIFIDGKLIEFTNQKAKELFAICIDKDGGDVTMHYAIELLWEGRNYDNKVKCLYRKAVLYLNTLFRRYGVEYIFCSSRGKCHVNKKEISCDYYEVLDGKNIEETHFDGRYMSNYSWSEKTCGRLCRMASIRLSE